MSQKSKKKHPRLNPIEDWLDLTTLGCLEWDGQRIGFYLLGDDTGDLSKLVIKFGFQCQGIHPLQRSHSQYTVIDQALSQGFKEITGTTVTFRWSSCSDFDGLTCSPETQERLNKPVSKEAYYFDLATITRQRELTEKKFARVQI